MHSLFQRADDLSHEVIGSAIEVHRLKGAGLLESIYEKCLRRELELCKIETVVQRTISIDYKGQVFEEILRFDLLVEGCLLVELKSVETPLPVHEAQLLTYLKLTDKRLGLLLNFNVHHMKDGIKRIANNL